MPKDTAPPRDPEIEAHLKVTRAIAALRNSDRGTQALKAVRHFMTSYGEGLDPTNQEATMTILTAFWGDYPATTLELIHKALDTRRKN